jgi:hypothetical protein
LEFLIGFGTSHTHDIVFQVIFKVLSLTEESFGSIHHRVRADVLEKLWRINDLVHAIFAVKSMKSLGAGNWIEKSNREEEEHHTEKKIQMSSKGGSKTILIDENAMHSIVNIELLDSIFPHDLHVGTSTRKLHDRILYSLRDKEILLADVGQLKVLDGHSSSPRGKGTRRGTSRSGPFLNKLLDMINLSRGGRSFISCFNMNFFFLSFKISLSNDE